MKTSSDIIYSQELNGTEKARASELGDTLRLHTSSLSGNERADLENRGRPVQSELRQLWRDPMTITLQTQTHKLQMVGQLPFPLLDIKVMLDYRQSH
jgi:hypothetical protein